MTSLNPRLTLLYDDTYPLGYGITNPGTMTSLNPRLTLLYDDTYPLGYGVTNPLPLYYNVTNSSTILIHEPFYYNVTFNYDATNSSTMTLLL